MKLYYAPGACSLADHIALHAAGLPFDHEKVDLKARRTESGADFTAINPKGYVPALTLDSGETLTENIAVLDWIAQQAPALAPAGPLGRTHLLEALAFISTELHKQYAPFFKGADEAAKQAARDMLAKRFDWIAGQIAGDYLFGAEPTVADFYLLVMLLWAGKFELPLPGALAALRDRLLEREPVRKAMRHEGLIEA